MSMTSPASVDKKPSPETMELMEHVVERGNMMSAYKQVLRNKGSAGIDKMLVDQLKPYLAKHWPEIKETLLRGEYKPQAVRVVFIPKPKGGQRQLGIPTVMDRLIQQALHQVLNPIYDPTFSENSYGFRKGKSAHQALKKAQEYQRLGKRWVVDMDLAKFFDEVNHDVLMSKIAKRIEDKRILRLIRSYLRSGIVIDGMVSQRDKGTPQGSPLSPLLSNIMLDELDKELERRGHRFCRYADDCNIYVGSRQSGERVLDSITKYVEGKLRLKVNREKSAVDRPWKRTFLGYSFTFHKEPRLRVPKETIQRFKSNCKQLLRRGRGRNLGKFIHEDLNPVILGWINYFGKAEVKGFAEDLDSWLRRRLRLILWRQWKRWKTRYKRLLSAGLSKERAKRSTMNGRGPWWNSGASHMNDAFRKKYFDILGLVSMLDKLYTLRIS
ncbi:MAG: group II intron reverse transcriptase/maturase [Candidatus Dadabacteria bacterium]